MTKYILEGEIQSDGMFGGSIFHTPFVKLLLVTAFPIEFFMATFSFSMSQGNIQNFFFFFSPVIVLGRLFLWSGCCTVCKIGLQIPLEVPYFHESA